VRNFITGVLGAEANVSGIPLSMFVLFLGKGLCMLNQGQILNLEKKLSTKLMKWLQKNRIEDFD